MNLELYLAFVLASTLLIIVPGPNVTLIVGNSLAHGARPALLTVAGTQVGQMVQLAVVAVGMASLLSLVAAAFEWLRWLGVAYLIWLGIQRWRATAAAAGDGPLPAFSPKALFWQGFLVAALNPKTLLFYAAFLPQFVDPQGAAGLQLAVMSLTFLAIASVLDSSYALLAGRGRQWLSTRVADRITGSLLIGAGVWLALARRN
jgi:threonine/homoserine/homoserine lactone efflux protein